MRGNQALEVVAGWACFHSRDEILKFPWKYSLSLSCVGVVRNVCLTSKPTFRIDCLWFLTQHTFWNRLNVAPKDPVPDRKSIVTWVTTFRKTGSPTRRRTGVPRLIRSSENNEAVRLRQEGGNLAIPRCSARKHASALGLSDRSVRRILHDDLHCHPYKMAIVQESTLDVLLPFVKGFSVLQSTGSTLDVSLPFVKGFSVLQSTGFTLDVSWPFVVKHDLKDNITE